MKIELIDAPIVLNLASKPDARTQLGKSEVTSKGKGFDPSVDRSEYVPRFLSAQAKNVILSDEEPSQQVLSVFRTPAADTQDYTVVDIDATAF